MVFFGTRLAKILISQKFSETSESNFNPIQDALFRGCSLIGEGEGGTKRPPPLPKICHTYPTMMELGTVTPYLKKIQKLYESRDTPLEFC